MDFKKYIPHLIAVASFLAVSMVFFAPNAFQGKALPQPDNDKARGMQTEIQDYLKKGEPSPLWTNSAFGGMPSYQIYVRAETDILRPIVRAPFLWADISSIWAQTFAAMLMTYLLLMVLGVDWRVGIFGALAFGITSYNIDIIEAGHSTKMAALALVPGMFAGAVLIDRGRYLLGGGILALLTAMQLYVNHLQITYYTLMILGIYFLVSLVLSFIGGKPVEWGKAVVVAVLAGCLGFATSTAKVWTTYEYGQESIRGKSELTKNQKDGDGLSYEYQFGWSYGIRESLTLLIPHAAGGGANESYKNTDLYKRLPADSRRQAGAYFYTGEQPFVGTAIYFGAIVCFLFLLGAIVVQGKMRIWLLTAGLFMVSLAWGKHFFFNDVLYNYFPMFNKFRAVTMALGMAQLCFVLLAALGLQRFFSGKMNAQQRNMAVYISAGVTAGLCLLAMIVGPAVGASDDQIGQNSPELLSMIQDDRIAMMTSDALRSIFFIAVAAGLLLLYSRGVLKAGLSVLLIAGLALADHWMVCTRTISSDDYVTLKNSKAPPAMQEFDRKINQDPDIHYRVLDLARGGIAGNAINSYFHKSINGYHAAKLRRFQEVVDTFLSANLGDNLHVLGMMNTKYIIGQKGEVIPNPKALGHVWFVNTCIEVPNADTELHALGSLNPADTLVVQSAYAGALKGLMSITRDSMDKIDLVKYHPDRMEYMYSAKTDQVAVFPEQYYSPDKGWKCYLNGKPYDDFFKADYFLRAIRLPAGQNQQFEMRFEPRSYLLGSKISLIASLLVILAFIGGLYWWFRHRDQKVIESDGLTDVESTKVVVAPKAAVAPAPKSEPKKKK